MIAQILDIYPLFFFLFSTSPFPHLSISVHLHLFSSLFCQTGASFSILCSITDVWFHIRWTVISFFPIILTYTQQRE
ncbi:hypothetical protein J3E71DRAFT_315298 [Bipolaris maydis]|nr:hypothetical protein J3E71DRAFT_315298 [Bipolaris maydis]